MFFLEIFERKFLQNIFLEKRNFHVVFTFYLILLLVFFPPPANFQKMIAWEYSTVHVFIAFPVLTAAHYDTVKYTGEAS
jgi:hypothetical protein